MVIKDILVFFSCPNHVPPSTSAATCMATVLALCVSPFLVNDFRCSNFLMTLGVQIFRNFMVFLFTDQGKAVSIERWVFHLLHKIQSCQILFVKQ